MATTTPSSDLSPRNHTRLVKVGTAIIGNGSPVVVQSMCATKTGDVEATVAQVDQLAAAGPGGPCGRRYAAGLRGLGRGSATDHRQFVGRSSRELPSGGRGCPLGQQDSLQSRPSVPSRVRPAVARQGPLPCRRGGPARLRAAGRRELRIGRSGQSRSGILHGDCPHFRGHRRRSRRRRKWDCPL